MSVQTYRHQNLDNDDEEERGPTPPLRGRTSSPPTVPYSQPSSSSLSSAHHDEMQSILQAHLDELTRAYQYEVAKQAWWGSSIPSAVVARCSIMLHLYPYQRYLLFYWLMIDWLMISVIGWILHVNGWCLKLSMLLASDKNSSPLIAPLMADWKTWQASGDTCWG